MRPPFRIAEIPRVLPASTALIHDIASGAVATGKARPVRGLAAGLLDAAGTGTAAPFPDAAAGAPAATGRAVSRAAETAPAAADYEAASAETDRGIGALDDLSRARRRVGQAMATSGLTGQLHVSGR